MATGGDGGAADGVLVFAHRGGMAHRPENTLPAFVHARSLGIGGVETDVWLTADGVPVLVHDGVVRTRSGRRRIAAVARPDLPGHIPSLSELYAACGTALDIALDILDPAAAAAVVAAATAAGGEAPGHLWLCGTSVEAVAAWRTLHPAPHLVHSDGVWRHHRRDAEGHLRRLDAFGIEVLNVHHRHCSAPLAALCHERGLKLFGWGVRRVPSMRRLIRIGVDGIMSDHADRLVAATGAPGHATSGRR